MSERRAHAARCEETLPVVKYFCDTDARFETAEDIRGYAAGKPPRALTKTSVNTATTGSESPGGNVRMASITEYCMDLNVHMRVQTRATRVYHRARVRRGSAASPPLSDPHSASADGSVTPRHAYFAMAHCRLRSMRLPTSPPT